METHIASTPFGSRPMSLALLVAQNSARELAEGKTVDKWQVYRWLCEGKSLIGVTDRALAILAALLSFHPDNELSEEGGLIVFPSNKQLSLRAHGMPDTTLRRHLGNLVDCGIIIRRDSPNGKRYARKGRGGELEEAFGFSLAPLLARAEAFQDAAERIQAENRALKLMRERITLYRRDIGKLIEAAVEEGVPGNWTGILERFRAIVDRLPRRATATELEPFVARLANLREEVDNILNSHMNAENPDGNESHNGRQHSNSNTDHFIEFEPALEKSGDEAAAAKETPEPLKGYPLGLVLRACPDIADYSTSGIASWRDLMATAAQVRGYLGVSPSAYADALDVMGQETTAIVIACMLQRANHINSAGGYLRTLTEKARAGQFSVGPMLMACLKANAGSERKAG
ncbi:MULTISPECIES: plasmid replication protein RepC [Chelativorans]|uniref:Replication protein C n=1 Tax=Chelativorans sp. (strain BNC1) TaxID=266779 RepID=Q11AK6_CHESB|nr:MULTISPECIES: plasmid replication protein RepC [Chelativorans]